MVPKEGSDVESEEVSVVPESKVYSLESEFSTRI